MISFWITYSDAWALTQGCACPLGLGVTADTYSQAVEMLQEAGYRLPDADEDLIVFADITFQELERVAHPHVLQHIGPIPVRGIWYPFTRVR